MSDQWKFECVVPEEFHQCRADVVLAKLYPMYSRNQWIQWLREGNIVSQDLALIPKYKLNALQVVSGNVNIETPFMEALAEDIALNIVYEDEDILVINKPSGLVVHPGSGQPNQTLMNALLFHQQSLEILPRAGIVHRLDKDTTGLMVVAKTPLSYQTLIQMMQERQIKRHYYALVHGLLRSSGTISTCFGRHPQNRLKMAVRPTGKTAVTHYRIKQHFRQNTLLNVALETGRTHQIRVHLNHIGFPIVGDKLYGKPKAVGKSHITEILNQFPRQALHAYHLAFMHPISKKPLTFDAVVPDDFALLLESIES